MKKRIKKKYTLKEFQAWLNGIEEIQPDDWHPDLEQWKLIRERMDNIITEVREKIVEVEVEVQPPHVMYPAAPISTPPVYPPIDTPPPLIPPVIVPANNMTPAAAAALQGEMPKDGSPSGQPVHKLPNDPAAADPTAPGTPYATSFA